MLTLAAELVIAFVAFYPLAVSAFWIAGGITFTLSDRHSHPKPEVPPLGSEPAVSLLIPAFNEAEVIADSIAAALDLDYPNYEVVVLDDGSTDGTVEQARAAGSGDPRVRVICSDTNIGKAARLNEGLRIIGSPLVMVVDADAQLHPQAMRLLVERMQTSPRMAAVAGDPRVTNRGSLLAGLQVLEFSSIIGLIRRSQAIGRNVGTIAGIIGMFRRDAVVDVGGYDPRMATEDIELSYRLLLAGWETDYEPRALIGMEVPIRLGDLWRQRRRWARGQGEVLRAHFGQMMRPRNLHLWPVAGEAMCSLLWLNLSLVAFGLLVVDWIFGTPISTHGVALAWGISVAVVSLIQLAVALMIDRRYDHRAVVTFALGPLYPAAYWMFIAATAMIDEGPALLRGAPAAAARWDTTRSPLSPAQVAERDRAEAA